MSTCSVYKHTNLVNGRVYIGITTQPVEERWNRGEGYKTSHYFYNAIQKYGWDNFAHEVLYTEMPREEAQQKEIELIAFYRASEKGCYNILPGGNLGRTGMPMSPEVREKLRNSLLGKVRSEEYKHKLSVAHTGKKLSEETKRKMSENNARYWQGKKRSPETLEKMRKGRLGKTHSPEAREKISAANVGRKRKNPFSAEHLEAISQSTRKAVLQMDLDGNLIREWASMRAAADYLEKKYINLISKSCRGLIPSAYGYKWKYANKGE